MKCTANFFEAFDLIGTKSGIVAQIIPGGQIAAMNGFLHKIDTVLVEVSDLTSGMAKPTINLCLILLSALFGMLRF